MKKTNKLVVLNLTWQQSMTLWNILHGVAQGGDDFGVIRSAKQIKKKLEKEWASHADGMGIRTYAERESHQVQVNEKG